MGEKRSSGSREKVVPTDTVFKIGELVTSSLAKIVNALFSPSKK
jgi:hypothetical protein